MKRPDEKAVKKSVSFPLFLYCDGLGRARALRFTTFSDYVQHLVRKDTESKDQKAAA